MSDCLPLLASLAALWARITCPSKASPAASSRKQAGAVVGAGLAIFATGLAGLVASEFGPAKWENLSKIVALTGVGSVGVVGALAAAQSLRDARAALSAGPQAPALPAGPPTAPSPTGAQTYTATSAESGRTLNMICRRQRRGFVAGRAGGSGVGLDCDSRLDRVRRPIARQRRQRGQHLPGYGGR